MATIKKSAHEDVEKLKHLLGKEFLGGNGNGEAAVENSYGGSSKN